MPPFPISKTKILVNGGAGYIGSHTTLELIRGGYQPIVLDNFCHSSRWIISQVEKITDTSIKVYEGDSCDENFVRDVFLQEKTISGVIHFTAFKDVLQSISYPLKYYKNNINSLMTVLSVMSEFYVKNLVFSSSASIYGDLNIMPVKESFPRALANTPYANTKLICEDIIRDTCHGSGNISGVSLRYFNPIGADNSGMIGEYSSQKSSSLISKITKTALGIHKKFIIFGNDYDTIDGTGVRDFIHISDLALAHISALDFLQKKTTGFYDTYNVGMGRGFTILEVLKSFEKVIKQTLPYKIGKRRSGDIGISWADISKIKNDMHWSTQKTLSQGLEDAWKWAKFCKDL